MNWKSLARNVGRTLLREGERVAKRELRQRMRGNQATSTPKRDDGRPAPQDRQPPHPSQSTNYPGDFRGHLEPVYDPHPDGLPDPGEIVWAWVPYEEDHSKGKDRPVLLIGHDGKWLIGLQITSKDHDADKAQEARAGRFWVDIGSGEWDSRGRESEVRVNRFIRIDPDAVRRIGAILDRERFDLVASEVARHS